MLSDRGNQAAAQLGLVFSLPNDLRALYSSFGIDLVRFNSDTTWALPISGRCIVDQQGNIIAADFDPDYTIRPEPEDIIAILKDHCS